MGSLVNRTVDLADAAEQGIAVAGGFDTAAMPQLTALIEQAAADAVGSSQAVPGTGHVDLEFSRHKSPAFIAVQGQLTFRCELVCQRCLELTEVVVTEPVKLAICQSDRPREDLVEVESRFARWDHDEEALAMASFVEELILLALPMVVVHADIADCGPLAQQHPAGATNEATQTPFAGLKDLLKSE